MGLDATFQAAVDAMWSVAADMLTDVRLKRISSAYNVDTGTNTESITAILDTTAFIDGYSSWEQANLPIQSKDQKMFLNGTEVKKFDTVWHMGDIAIDTSWKVEIDDVDWNIVNVKADSKRIYWECQIRRP